jgi:peptidoglycan/LPS O-acetylase OafA/YrhL
LDGLRGYAAATVVFYHTILGPSPELARQVVDRGVEDQRTLQRVLLKLALTLFDGEWAVAVFFVISGIVLFRALAGMHRGSGPRAMVQTGWRFLLRRFLRIWPVMAVCLVVHTVCYQLLDPVWPGLAAVYSWPALLDNLTLLRTPINGATWSLGVELAGAPLLVAAFFGVRRFGLFALIPLFLYATLAFFAPKLLAGSQGLIAGIPALLIGALLECGGLDWAARMRAWRWAPVAGAGLVLLDFLFVRAASHKVRAVLLFVGVALFVGWVRLLQQGRVFDFLHAPLSQYLGRISFSLYLWNVPVFMILFLLCDQEKLRAYPLLAGLATGFAAIMVTIPIADLSERWLERPCVRLGRALTKAGPEPLVTSGAGAPGSLGSAPL